MSTASSTPTLTTTGKWLVLVVAFLGWLFCGVHMSITSLAMQPAAIDLLGRNGELDAPQYRAWLDIRPKERPAKLSDAERSQLDAWDDIVGRWFAWLQTSFLFGAASGGLLFGRLGDRIGRAKAMSLSILTYSIMAAVATQAQTPLQLALAWYTACLGLGGMWPNGVALVSEAWSNVSRSFIAGAIGTSANVGIFSMATFVKTVTDSPSEWLWLVRADDWSWMFWVGATPVVLGVFSLIAVPESPRWLASQGEPVASPADATTTWTVFRHPYLGVTIVGILLATVPMIGGWGSANWMVPWAKQAGGGITSPADVQQARALTGMVGSVLGGWIAVTIGRRLTYFLTSLATLVIAQYSFWFLTPTDRTSFLIGVGALGFFSGIYFGWMPLCLPELYPTKVRSTGGGVCFNFGRILTAATVFGAGWLFDLFDGKFERIGRVTSLFFAVGMVVICFAPDTSKKQLSD